MRWKTLDEWTRERDRLLAAEEETAAEYVAQARAILDRWADTSSVTKEDRTELTGILWAHGHAVDRAREYRECLPPDDLLTVEDVIELVMSRADARHVAGKSGVEEPKPINPALIEIFEQYRLTCPTKARRVRAFVKWAREHNAKLGMQDGWGEA